jgi:hypothetical protein
MNKTVKPHDPTKVVEIEQDVLDFIFQRLSNRENMTYWDCIASCLYESEAKKIPIRILVDMRNNDAYAANDLSKLNPDRYKYAMLWYEENTPKGKEGKV